MNAGDIHYEYNTRGYMMYYKDKPIGGAGIANSAKGCLSNLTLFRDCAETTKRQLISGQGDRYMLDEINKIEKELRI